MKKNYRHIFFDLDHTLWDFDKNSHETLTELYEVYALAGKGIADADEFVSRYKYRNEYLWGEYRKGLIDVEFLRVNRFIATLADFQVNDKAIAYQMSEKYLSLCPEKMNLLPFASETLGYLKEKYELHIITNGFHQVQLRKVKNCSLDIYFKNIFTSDLAGCLKPQREIFDYSLAEANASCEESIYIGDNLEVDILGARNAGMDQIYYNPASLQHKESISYEVLCLSEIQDIL